MARVYALLQPDETLLFARARGTGWAVGTDPAGIEARGKNLTVFLSGLDVSGHSAMIPARNENEARRAAPFAVEDELAEGVEASHVALSELDKSDNSAARWLNVVSVSRLKDIVATLADRDFDDAEIIAAHSLLPMQNMLFEAPGLVFPSSWTF